MFPLRTGLYSWVGIPVAEDEWERSDRKILDFLDVEAIR
jgi:hypothetical protein